MRVLACHVRYRRAGGEDVVFDSEVELLRRTGVSVATLDMRSADLDGLSLGDKTRMALSYSDHRWGRDLVRRAIAHSRPDVVHFHNLYPQLGPGAVLEADALGCATVQTLHNYRLSCLAGTHLRNGDICQLCSPARFLPGVCHGCYRDSRAQSALASRATARAWRNFIRRGQPMFWLALTDFMRSAFIGLGAPRQRIIVKPNSVDAGRPLPAEKRRGVFCGGRLSTEKGIVPLLRAWPDDGPRLTVAGSGPLEREVQAALKSNVTYVGRLDQDGMRAAMRSARVVAMPSVWPEPISLVTLEAFAEGTPVVAFEGWSLGSVVKELSPRCTVPFRDFVALAACATQVATGSDWDTLSSRALLLWQTRYRHEINVHTLTRLYEHAIALKVGRAAGPAGASP
jgi:glycosyltransferase involved in cell wall biosynthesis